MGMITWAKSFFMRSTKADPAYGVAMQFYSPGQPVWSEKNYGAFVREGYRRNGTAYACINKIAGVASGIKWKLYTDESKSREIERHPLLDLWKTPNRSEEHTSELQSRQYLVCRLLLEKKKKK